MASSTKGDYESLIKTLFRGNLQILAYDLYKGMKGLSTNTDVLNEIICCCNNDEIHMLKRAYHDGKYFFFHGIKKMYFITDK
ncbi:unnamed protein product [Trichobilharzia regenti]|nr:unnamed protein product [Trichobilharzia regenti]